MLRQERRAALFITPAVVMRNVVRHHNNVRVQEVVQDFTRSMKGHLRTL